MDQLPWISVIVPVYNGARTIGETLKSLFDQQYPRLEILVMDGGSTDQTVEIVRGFPEVLLFSEKDSGPTDAVIKGHAHAKGEIVTVLPADDLSCSGTLFAVGSAFLDHPDWDGVFGDIEFIDVEGRRLFLRKEFGFDYDILRFGMNNICSATLFLRRTAYDRVGGYDLKRFRVADYDLLLRLGRDAFQIGQLPQLLARYRIHAGSQSVNRRVLEMGRMEEEAMLAEHGRPDGGLRVVLKIYHRIRRQLLKLLYRGSLDLIPGTWRMRVFENDLPYASNQKGVGS